MSMCGGVFFFLRSRRAAQHFCLLHLDTDSRAPGGETKNDLLSPLQTMRMKLTGAQLKGTLRQVWSVFVRLFTADSPDSWRNKVLLSAFCLALSVLLSCLLFLGLCYSLKYETAVSAGVAVAFCGGSTIALSLSQNVRCFAVLVLISCGLKQIRNLLTAAGTSLVVLWNVRNTLENLRGLAKSLLCNLEAKKILVDLAPLSNYVQMLRWVGGQLKHFTDFGAGELRSEFKLSASADSVVFKQKLSEAKQVLNQTAVSALAAMNMTSSVAQKLLPALGILLLVLLTARYVKKYRTDRGFQNIFITDALLRYDEQQRAEGKPSIFPLTEKEKKRYISIPSSRPSAKEGKAMLKFGFPVFTNLLIWLFFIGIDALVYWLIGVLRTRLEELEPFQIPVIMHLKEDKSVIGIPIHVDRERRDYSYNLTLFEQKCLPEPRLMLYSTVPLLVILTLLTCLSLLSAKLTQLRLLVSERFFSEHAAERARHLHQKILRKRNKWKVGNLKGELATLVKQAQFWCPILFGRQQDNFEPLT
ncbi:dendritic cell-specific transmembrane protein isoform X1 [Clupea harengus]|uniref:Dendritic cell-specific transmembrane protein isoform X1 n=2 Tax=Clupea harengus TaxID=7950 RepID=A0A6P8GBI5_CLUHA|nr:dendritic cell-specific transmembrane protein isoform X1 [Clupea harengus]